MKKLIVILMALFAVLTVSAQRIYDFKVMDDVGQEISLSDYKGHHPGNPRVLHGQLRHPASSQKIVF
jgi:hypothetical protein